MTPESNPMIKALIENGDAEARLSAIIEGSDDAIVSTRLDGTVTSWNHGAELIYGYQTQEMLGQNIGVIYPESDRHSFDEILQRIVRGERMSPFEAIRQRKDGSTIEVEIRASPIFAEGGQIIGASALARDISDRRERDRDLRESHEFLQRTQELSGVGSWRSSLDEQVPAFWTTVMYRIFGLEESHQITSHDFYNSVYPEDRALVGEVGKRVLASALRESVEFRIVRPDGAIRWIFGATDARLDASGTPIGLTGVCRDVTEAKEAEARLAHDALHDPLTGLPNRALLLDRIERALTRANQDRSRVAVLFADLDRFKLINDSRGHEHGDAILQAVARRLRELSRVTDTVGRLSGDEIVLVSEDIRNGIEATERATQMIALFQEPFTIADRSTHVTASIGVAVSAPDSTAEGLVRDADLAMYRAKERGRNRFELFDLELRERTEQRSTLEAGLWRALDNDELFLEFQPIASLEQDQFIGVEALVRWQHPERGTVEPDEFIPIAEETSLIIPIGTWVMQQACQQLRRWRDATAGSRDWRMSINVSTVQLRTLNFLEILERELTHADLDPSWIQLELTESILLDLAFAQDVLPKIRALGVRLSIDDFGTGYSSLAYLKHLSIDELKIDESFVGGLLAEDSSLAIVSAIISIGRSLDLLVTAEGVESEAQLGLLRQLHCQAAQGFFFSEPLRSDDCLAVLIGSPSTSISRVIREVRDPAPTT